MIVTCQFCSVEEDIDNTFFFQKDKQKKGFWCETCDGYNSLSENERNRFTLILEDKTNKEKKTVLPTYHLSKRISPLRYPGGKSKLADYILTKIRADKTELLVSPYTGGASVELAFLYAGIFQKIHLNDLDYGVFSLFWLIKHSPEQIIDRILKWKPDRDDYFRCQSIIKSDYSNTDMIEAAWSLLVVNRLAFSGIYKANPLGGKKGSTEQLLSRWNAVELCKRIKLIHSMRERITVTNTDACEVIEEAYWNEKITVFVDPPYVQQGKNLYHCFYEKEDHIRLNVLLDSLYHTCPGADMIITYDNDNWLKQLYNHPEIETIGRVYTI